MVAEALTDLFASSNLPDLNTCTLAKELYPELVASLSESPLAYAQVSPHGGEAGAAVGIKAQTSDVAALYPLCFVTPS